MADQPCGACESLGRAIPTQESRKLGYCRTFCNWRFFDETVDGCPSFMPLDAPAQRPHRAKNGPAEPT